MAPPCVQVRNHNLQECSASWMLLKAAAGGAFLVRLPSLWLAGQWSAQQVMAFRCSLPLGCSRKLSTKLSNGWVNYGWRCFLGEDTLFTAGRRSRGVHPTMCTHAFGPSQPRPMFPLINLNIGDSITRNIRFLDSTTHWVPRATITDIQEKLCVAAFFAYIHH